MPKYTCKVCGRALKSKGWLTRHLKKWDNSPLGYLMHRIANGAITKHDLRTLARKFGVDR